MDKFQTLHTFWSSFGLPAYDENTVPDNAVLPYITYEVQSSNFGNSVALTASLWYRDTGWAKITAKQEQIADFIGRGGRQIAYDNGSMWIQMGTPFAQRMGEQDDDTIRRIVMNITAEFMD